MQILKKNSSSLESYFMLFINYFQLSTKCNEIKSIIVYFLKVRLVCRFDESANS